MLIIVFCTHSQSKYYTPASIIWKHKSTGPSDYTSDHEWLVIENNIAILSITNYPQEALGKIVCLQSPDVWAVLKRRRNKLWLQLRPLMTNMPLLTA